MSTEVSAPLAIPEQTIVGTGSYTVPANRYGHLSMYTSSTRSWGASGPQGAGQGNGSGTSNSNTQYVVSGDIISVATSAVRINGVNACRATSSIAATAGTGSPTPQAASAGSSSQGWSIALYRIPKSNLPIGTAEGE